MKTTYEAVRPLEDGKPVPVVERDESGALVGAWIGYWSYKRETVALYPDVKNKFVNWPNGRVPNNKRLVNDRYIKNKTRIAESKIDNTVPESQKGENWRDRKPPMKSQERMDI